MAVMWQRLEGALVMIAALALFIIDAQSFPIWASILLFFAPDLSFVGYVAGSRFGALCYNTVHIYGFGAALLAVGAGFSIPAMMGLGLLWLAHSGFDRMLGYGLKLPGGFSETHLGSIGKSRP